MRFVEPEYPLPLDPDLMAGRIDASTLVDCGHRDASRYLAGMTPGGIVLTPGSTRMKTPGHGIAFREAMTGRITFGVTDPQIGYDDPAAVPFVLKASIDIRDIDAFIAERTHSGDLTGHLYAPRAGFILPSTGGVFRLFSPSGDPALTEMVYETGYRRDGKPYYFRGHKHVRIGWPWRAWRETTTLYVTLHEGDDAGPVIGAGILRLNFFDLLALMGTFHATECERPKQRWRAIAGFAGFFMRELWRLRDAEAVAVMNANYDVVVIGSGFGGAVAACGSRMPGARCWCSSAAGAGRRKPIRASHTTPGFGTRTGRRRITAGSTCASWTTCGSRKAPVSAAAR